MHDGSANENSQTFGEGVTEIQTTPAVTHLSFSDRKQAEAFYNGFKNGKIPGINDGEGAAPVEVSWVASSAAALPGSTSSSVNTVGNGAGGDALDSAMGDADGGDTGHREGGAGGDGKADQDGAGGDTQDESQALNHQQSQQQQESGEAKAEVDYDVAGENEWDE